MKLWNKFCIALALYVSVALVNAILTYVEIGDISTKMTFVEIADDLANAILEVRRYEKNYLLFRNEDHLKTLKQYLEKLIKDVYTLKKEVVEAIGISDYDAMKQSIAEYTLLMDNLWQKNFTTNTEERKIIERMRSEARKIQGFVENFSKEARAEIRDTLKRSRNLLFLAVMSILILGPVITIQLARSIVIPLRRLEHLTKKVAEGDFTEKIEIKGKDEIASLSISFNQMEDNLKNALWSLEHAVEKLREKQAQLVEAEKLAAVGKLAAGIAHEINNPLTSVLTFSNLMLEQCPPTDPRCERLKMMVHETERARNIVRQLLNFGRGADIKPVKMNVNQPVSEIIDSLTAQAAFKGIELVTHLSDSLPDISIDHAQIGQVVLNILLNAIHAITPPGRIKVTTRTADNYVEIVISDSGAGIPAEHLGKIFDPFFTTKGGTKGMGLGLAVSYGIIKKHGGDIAVMSTVGEGATFIVRLPVGKTEGERR